MEKDLHKRAISIAQRSRCTKRKVGAVIINKQNSIIGEGCNHFPVGKKEFDKDGNTSKDVIHAEVAACNTLPNKHNAYKIIVTHQPCNDCMKVIKKAGITKIELVTSFMKWSKDKIKYGLVPVIALKGLAQVFTYGAKKYKPRNYLKCEDPQEFVHALFRHLEDYRNGEIIDPESGLPHLAHLMCNAAILLDIENERKEND